MQLGSDLCRLKIDAAYFAKRLAQVNNIAQESWFFRVRDVYYNHPQDSVQYALSVASETWIKQEDEQAKRWALVFSGNIYAHDYTQFTWSEQEYDYYNIAIQEDANVRYVVSYSSEPFTAIKKHTGFRIKRYIEKQKTIIQQKCDALEKELKQIEPPKLVKDEFETIAGFKERVAKTEKEIADKTAQTKAPYEKEIEKIKNKIEIVQEGKNWVLARVFLDVFGKPVLENAKYDAERETMYVSLKAANADYAKTLAVSMPLERAKSFKEKIQQVKPRVQFRFLQDTITLQRVTLELNDKNDNEEYLAPLSTQEFQPIPLAVNIENPQIDTSLLLLPDSKFSINASYAEDPEIAKLQEKIQQIKTKEKEDEGRESKLKELRKQLAELQNKSHGSYDDDLPGKLNQISPAAEDANKYLIVIGIENYDEVPTVPFSSNSAKLFKQFAQKAFGVCEYNASCLLDNMPNNTATATRIKNTVKLVAKKVKDGGTIYFYYSGHGLPSPKEGGEAYILPQDGSTQFFDDEKDLQLAKIYEALGNSKASRVICFIDACFSGKSDNKMIIKGIAPALIQPKEAKFDAKKMSIFTASDRSQFSNQYAAKGHRMFSYFLMDGLARKHYNVIDLHSYVREKVVTECYKLGSTYEQTPQFYGNNTVSLK